MEIGLSDGRYRITASSMTGRRGENQDRYCWVAATSGRLLGENMGEPLPERSVTRPDMLMAVVCDGMGGMRHGGEASRMVCDGLAEWALSCDPDGIEGMRGSFAAALKEIESVLRAAIYGSGTTMSAVLHTGGCWLSVHVGDSRCYRVTGEDVWRTRDHSPVEDLFQSGGITEEQMNTHPMSNLIDNFIGGGDARYAEASDLGDVWHRLALCSDGAFGYMTSAEFRRLVTESPNADSMARSAYNLGSSDNITVLAIDRLG